MFLFSLISRLDLLLSFDLLVNPPDLRFYGLPLLSKAVGAAVDASVVRKVTQSATHVNFPESFARLAPMSLHEQFFGAERRFFFAVRHIAAVFRHLVSFQVSDKVHVLELLRTATFGSALECEAFELTSKLAQEWSAHVLLSAPRTSVVWALCQPSIDAL